MRPVTPVRLALMVLVLVARHSVAAAPAAVSSTATLSSAPVAAAPVLSSTVLAVGPVASATTVVPASEPAVPVPATVAEAAPAATVPGAEARFIPIVDADIRGAGSKVSSAHWTGGVVGSVFALPAYRLAPSTLLLPIYAFEGSLFNRVVEEVVLFQSRQVHSGSLGVKQGLGGGWDAKLSFDAAYALTQEARGETMGKGLYDYLDLGGRAGATWNLEELGRKAPASFSVRAYHRAYPNFRSLAAENAALLLRDNPGLAAEIGGREKHPKDFNAIEPALSGAWWWTPQIQTRASWATSVRAYTDRYLRTDQGAMSSTKRSDQMHQLAAETSVGGLGAFSAGAGVSWIRNMSNESVYDANQPSHAYIPRFYQFSSVSLEPWAQWVAPGEGTLRPRVRAGLSVLARTFDNRPAQRLDGAYTNSRQHDAEYGASLRGWYPVRSWLSLTAGADGRLVRSNNEFRQFIRYRYEVLTLSAGVALSY